VIDTHCLRVHWDRDPETKMVTVELPYRPGRAGGESHPRGGRLIIYPPVLGKWCRYVYAEYDMFTIEPGKGFEGLVKEHLEGRCEWMGSWEMAGREGQTRLKKRRLLVRWNSLRRVNEAYWDLCFGKDDVMDGIDIDCFSLEKGSPFLFAQICAREIAMGAEVARCQEYGTKVEPERVSVRKYEHEKVQK
jgi:hypothetical protein